MLYLDKDKLWGPWSRWRMTNHKKGSVCLFFPFYRIFSLIERLRDCSTEIFRRQITKHNKLKNKKIKSAILQIHFENGNFYNSIKWSWYQCSWSLFVKILAIPELGISFKSCSPSRQNLDRTSKFKYFFFIIWNFWNSNAEDIKFIYSEKATKFCEISTVDLTVTS